MSSLNTCDGWYLVRHAYSLSTILKPMSSSLHTPWATIWVLCLHCASVSGSGLTGWVAANRQTIRNSDPVLDLGEAARALTPRLRSCLSTPLVMGAELVGALTLYSSGRDTFSEEHQRVIEVVARQVSPIIRRSVDVSKSKASMLRDALTGLPTVEHLRQLASPRFDGGGLPIPTSVLMIDIDDLRVINQEHGRQCGDRVLSRVVTAAKQSLRDGDLLFRHGSDEFVALLLQTDRTTSNEIAARLLAAVTASQSSEHPPFRISVVAATAPQDGTSLDDLMSAAARANTRISQLVHPPESGPSNSVH